MARVTKALAASKKHKKVLKATKGHYGARSRLYKTAKQSNIKALQYSFRDRKARKRRFRNLWISRINSGARNLGVSYSVLINSLKNGKKILKSDFLELKNIAGNISSQLDENIYTIKDILDS